METEKNIIRKQKKRARDQMLPEQVSRLSEQICAQVTASDEFAQASCIFAYFPLGNEADVRPVVREAWRRGKRVAFPKVFGEAMAFFEIRNFSQLHPGTFGVMEPEETFPAEWEDGLMLVPGVAFDRRGNRMGFGRGYYDRYLAAHPGCIRMGIAYELQVADEIPVEQTDIPLDILVTETGVH